MLQIISCVILGVSLFLTGIATIWIDVFQIVKFADKETDVNEVPFNNCIFPYKN